MECVGLSFVLFVAAVLVAVYLSVRAQSRVDVWNQAFAWVTRRFGGQLSLGGWFHQPQWRLHYGETFVRLTTYKVGGSRGARFVEFSAQFPDVPCRLEVFPTSADTTLLPIPADLPPASLGDEFASAWTVLTTDEPEARRVLSQQVRFHLEQLRRTPEWADVYLSLHRPGWLTIRRKWTSTRPADMETFVELALGLVDQALLTRTSGIDFVDDGQVKVIDEARCLVCGEGLLTDLVYCRRCKTPHHRECWEYSGGCSTYGCRETQFLVPQHLPRGDGGSSEPRAEPLWPRPAKPR